MPKKSTKLKALTQVNAKVETSQKTSLDQVWGFDSISRYGTIDENEYSSRLSAMTSSDLENHAVSVGCIVPTSPERFKDYGRLKESLIKQFRAYVSSLKKPAAMTHPVTKVSPEALKVLNEGR